MHALTILHLTLALTLIAVASDAHAIFKCQQGAQTVYQDKPCTAGSQSEIGAPGQRYGAQPVRPLTPSSRATGATASAAKSWQVASKIAPPFKPDLTEPQIGLLMEAAPARVRGKGEFETTAEYNKRLAQRAIPKTFLLEKKTLLSSALAYDADRQIMKVDFGAVASTDSPAVSTYSSAPPEVQGKSVLWLDGGASKSGAYVGENAFGSKRVVEKYVATSWGLIPGNLPARRTMVIELPLPPHQARSLKSEGRWQIRGSVTGDGVQTWQAVTKPTISDPQDKRVTYYLAPATIDRVELVDGNAVVIVAIEPIR